MNSDRQNVQVSVPQESFKVEEGLPELPTTGRQGQSKYTALMDQAKALKPGTHFKVPVDPKDQRALVRNIRVAIKRFAPKSGLKVTASGSNQVAVYRDSE